MLKIKKEFFSVPLLPGNLEMGMRTLGQSRLGGHECTVLDEEKEKGSMDNRNLPGLLPSGCQQPLLGDTDQCLNNPRKCLCTCLHSLVAISESIQDISGSIIEVCDGNWDKPRPSILLEFLKLPNQFKGRLFFVLRRNQLSFKIKTEARGKTSQ